LKRPTQKSLPSPLFQREESFGEVRGGRFPFSPFGKRGFSDFSKDYTVTFFLLSGGSRRVRIGVAGVCEPVLAFKPGHPAFS
jgi:hypothetical protein